jgi:hypothetical protein
VSHYHPNARTAEVEPLWALVASSLARIAAWDSNVILARTSQHDTHEAFASNFRACMYQCRRWLLAADESALVEAEWHVATMLAFARRGADGSSQYTTRALCVFLTLLQYHHAQSSAPALELFFRTATSKASPALARGRLRARERRRWRRSAAGRATCAHAAVWIASHVAPDQLDARADEALMELHI